MATAFVPPRSAAQSADALFDAVYARLKHLAHDRFTRLRDGDSLDTTALVHELYLRVCTGRELTFAHPAQFFAYAGRAMRHLLSDRARNRLRQRNGGEWQRVSLADAEHQPSIDTAEGALALEEALQKLERLSPRSAQIVELLYFAGLSIDQVAQVLELSRRTVDRDWRFARALLNDLLA
ncbi:MAG: ECF-type sigma factor [Rudaea sp.]|uniref:ECF-type sigma factor n=1 Tax=Rudaea sp. TaxID=2136325 RepID=UPI0039E35957